jgi:hypothetical protein
MAVIEYARRKRWRMSRLAYRLLLFLGVLVCLAFAAEMEVQYSMFSYYFRSKRPGLHVAANAALVLAVVCLIEAIFLVLRRRFEGDDG